MVTNDWCITSFFFVLRFNTLLKHFPEYFTIALVCYILLRNTTGCLCGSDPRSLGPESDALPLDHHAPPFF